MIRSSYPAANVITLPATIAPTITFQITARSDVPGAVTTTRQTAVSAKRSRTRSSILRPFGCDAAPVAYLATIMTELCKGRLAV